MGSSPGLLSPSQGPALALKHPRLDTESAPRAKPRVSSVRCYGRLVSSYGVGSCAARWVLDARKSSCREVCTWLRDALRTQGELNWPLMTRTLGCSRDGWLRSCRLSEDRKSEADEILWLSSKKVRLPGRQRLE
jgi:hypothetical protein